MADLYIPNKSQKFNSYFEWIKKCPPKIGCQLTHEKCKFCTSPFCTRHGQYQRIERANKILAKGIPEIPTWSLVLKVGITITPKEASRIQQYFFKELRRHKLTDGYVWVWEWKDYVPHLNAINLCYEKYDKSSLKEIWIKALEKELIPDASNQEVYCRPTRNYSKWMNYIFKTKEVLTKHTAPPVVGRERWNYYSSSKNYLLASVCGPCTRGPHNQKGACPPFTDGKASLTPVRWQLPGCDALKVQK